MDSRYGLVVWQMERAVQREERGGSGEGLLAFFESNVATQDGIILAKLKALSGVTLVFDGVVDVGAFGAFQFDLDAIVFLSHGRILLDSDDKSL